MKRIISGFVILVFIAVLMLSGCSGLGDEGKIHINQIGYRPSDTKIAVVNSQNKKLKTFEVIDDETGEVVFTGSLTGEKQEKGENKAIYDAASRDQILYADFTSVTEPGAYHLSITDYDQSYSFRIAQEVYDDVKNAMLKALYYQRCGMDLEEKYAGLWKHPLCHPDDGYLFEDQNTQIDTTGGWHDAGDFGKYVVPAAVTAADLMLAYEFFPESFEEDINIPESGNGIPDILDETRWALDWMLKMQDPQTGGVYHKVTTNNFAPFMMPQYSGTKRFILPISPTATGDFAAVMAMASRVFRAFDQGFSDRALAAAEQAWSWLKENPNAPNYRNPSGVQTGEYGDNSSEDERYWAAMELYRATLKQEYHDYIHTVYQQDGLNQLGLGWQDVGGFGTITYLRMDKDEVDKEVYDSLKATFIDEADILVELGSSDGYKMAMKLADYYWGSNMVVMNRAVHLIIANSLQEEQTYIQTAQNHLHYLFGRNALDQSYLTGYGSKPVMVPHHRPSASDDVADPIPGMVAGGPNKYREDPTAEKKLPSGVAPARAYLDHQDSWSTNEITTYWNSPAVFVAGYFSR